MTQPKTFWQSYSEGLSPEERIEARKRGLPLPDVPPRASTTPAPVLLKKGSEPPPAPTTMPSPTPAPATPNPIEALKAQVAASIAKGATPYEAWCRVRYEHPQLVQQARQVPVQKMLESPPAVVALQAAHEDLQKKVEAVISAGAASNPYEALSYLRQRAPGYVAMIRRGEVPR